MIEPDIKQIISNEYPMMSALHFAKILNSLHSRSQDTMIARPFRANPCIYHCDCFPLARQSKQMNWFKQQNYNPYMLPDMNEKDMWKEAAAGGRDHKLM